MDPSFTRRGSVAPVGAIAETLVAGLQPAPARTSTEAGDAGDIEADQAVARAIAAAGVPLRHQAASFADTVPRPGLVGAIDAARRMAAGELDNLILAGPFGSGKTRLSVAILRARIEAHMARWPLASWEVAAASGSVCVMRRPPLDLRFLVVPTFLDALRSSIRHAGDDDPLPTLFDVDLLVLDDLGAERGTDWALERLVVLVGERYNRCRRTIATTNFGLDELAGRGYGAIVSRLLEDGEAIRIAASDYRVEGAA